MCNAERHAESVSGEDIERYRVWLMRKDIEPWERNWISDAIGDPEKMLARIELCDG